MRRRLRAGAQSAAAALGGAVTGVGHQRHALCRHGGGASCRPDAVWDMRLCRRLGSLIGVAVDAPAGMSLVMRGKDLPRLCAAAPVCFTLAIVGMHFTAMAAVLRSATTRLSMRRRRRSLRPARWRSRSPPSAAFIVALGLIGGDGGPPSGGARAGRSRSACAHHIAELEATQQALEADAARSAPTR